MRALPIGFLLLPMLLALPTGDLRAQETERILAFGDSISIGFREPGVDCARPVSTAAGYPEHLEELLVADGYDVQVVPSGICGETTFGALTRIDQVLGSQEGKIVIVMEGTNDVSRGGDNTISNETIVDNLTLIAQKIAADGRTPVLSSIIPYGRGADRQATNNLRAGNLSEDLRDLARELGVPFADPFNDLLSVPNLFDRFYHPDGYHLTASGNEILAESFVRPASEALDGLCEPGPCVPGPHTLCLADDKFRVSVKWRVGDQVGVGTVNPLPGGDTGTVWFFSPDNLELVIKVLDGRCSNGAYWVFYGGLSDVELEIRVIESETCRQVFYDNPAGEMASVGDTFAFPAACPGS